MRVMIAGARGQLGLSLRQAMPEDWELIATDSKTLDITQKNAVNALIGGFLPDILINAAGFTDVDAAEHKTETVFDVNARGALILAESAQKYGARFVHYSTDYVFDGKSHKPYREIDPPCPLNVYGCAKLAGELLVMAAHPNALIIRTSSVFSPFGHNFVLSVLDRAQRGDTIDVVEELMAAPTYAPALASATMSLLRADNPVRGIFHYSGAEVMNRCDFARRILDCAGYHHVAINKIHADKNAAMRPHYSVLDCSKIAEYEIPLMPLNYALQETINYYNDPKNQ